MKKVSDVALQAAVVIQLAYQRIIQHILQHHTFEVIVVGRILSFTGLMLAADQALAATLGSWVQSFKTGTLQPIMQFGMYGAYAIGMGCAGVGVNEFIKLSKGDQQSSFGEGAGWTFGGGALMGLGAIANSVGESMSAGGCATGTYCGK